MSRVGSDSSDAIFIIQRYQVNHVTIDKHLAHVLEIHGHAIADDGLDLPQPPVLLSGVADPEARDEDTEAFCHGIVPGLRIWKGP